MTIWINCGDNDRTYTKKNYLLDTAIRLGMVELQGVKPPKIMIKDYSLAPKDYKPDFILNIEPFEHFVKGKIWTGIWEIDLVLDRREMSLSDWAESNNVFIANSTIPERMLPFKDKTQLLFQACDIDIHRKTPNIEEFDFVFSGSTGSGNFYDKRSEYIDLLRKHFTFADYGKNHRPKEYTKLLSKARVQFVQSGCNHNAPNGYIAQRFFECLAIGPVLTNYHPDLELLGLVEGEDYMSFKDSQELLQKMSFLIMDQQLRAKIANSGRNKALFFHTYEHRLITVINQIRDSLATR
jgi:hypothetical protein